MQNFATKSDNVSSLSASEFNNLVNDLENHITDAGITLSEADEHQTAKAVANMVSHGDVYDCTNIANALTLTKQASKQAPTALAEGLRCRFKSSVTNTGATTVNVNALGVKSIYTPSGAELSGGEITINAFIEIVYDTDLAGFVITNSNIKKEKVTNRGTTYTVLDNDGIETLVVTSGIGVTLPTPGDNIGRSLVIYNDDASASSTITRDNASDRINGNDTDLELNAGQAIILKFIAANKIIMIG